MTAAPQIGVFKRDEQLVLEPAPNGGWVVLQHPREHMVKQSVIGAYTTTKDMLAALGEALTTE